MTVGIVFYSRTGNTRKAAELLADKIKAKGRSVELVEIEAVRRPGFLTAGHASQQQKELPIKNEPADLGKYEFVVFGVPVWAGLPSPMLKSFLAKVPGSPRVPAACFLCGSGKAETHDRAVACIKDCVAGKGFLLHEPVLEIQMGRKGIIGQSPSIDDFLASVLTK